MDENITLQKYCFRDSHDKIYRESGKEPYRWDRSFYMYYLHRSFW